MKKPRTPIGIDQNTGRVRFRFSRKNPVIIYSYAKVKVSGKIKPQIKLTKRLLKKLMKEAAKERRKHSKEGRDDNW